MGPSLFVVLIAVVGVVRVVVVAERAAQLSPGTRSRHSLFLILRSRRQSESVVDDGQQISAVVVVVVVAVAVAVDSRSLRVQTKARRIIHKGKRLSSVTQSEIQSLLICQRHYLLLLPLPLPPVFSRLFSAVRSSSSTLLLFTRPRTSKQGFETCRLCIPLGHGSLTSRSP